MDLIECAELLHNFAENCTKEEMADFIIKLEPYMDCDYFASQYCHSNCHEDECNHLKDCIIKWLDSEVKE